MVLPFFRLVMMLEWCDSVEVTCDVFDAPFAATDDELGCFLTFPSCSWSLRDKRAWLVAVNAPTVCFFCPGAILPFRAALVAAVFMKIFSICDWTAVLASSKDFSRSSFRNSLTSRSWRDGMWELKKIGIGRYLGHILLKQRDDCERPYLNRI